MKNLLLVPAIGNLPQISINDTAIEKKARLALAASSVTAIARVADRDHALSVVRDIKEHLADLESSRVEVKKPFLDTCRMIDDVARKHIGSLESEKRRISKLLGEFEANRRNEVLKASATAQDDSKPLEERLDAELAIESSGESVEGGMLRSDWVIEVTDIVALYQAQPTCVRLTPVVSNIKYFLNLWKTLPGVKAEKTPAFTARATKKD